MKRPTNGIIASGISTTEPSAATWEAFDNLPRAIRRVLFASPMPINPQSAVDLATAGGDDYAREALAQAIGEEVRRFSTQHTAAHGYPLPALVAGVGPQPHRDDTPATKPRPARRAIIRPTHRRHL